MVDDDGVDGDGRRGIPADGGWRMSGSSCVCRSGGRATPASTLKRDKGGRAAGSGVARLGS